MVGQTYSQAGGLNWFGNSFFKQSPASNDDGDLMSFEMDLDEFAGKAWLGSLLGDEGTVRGNNTHHQSWSALEEAKSRSSPEFCARFALVKVKSVKTVKRIQMKDFEDLPRVQANSQSAGRPAKKAKVDKRAAALQAARKEACTIALRITTYPDLSHIRA